MRMSFGLAIAVAAAAAANASAETVVLDTTSLPSTQGWTYVGDIETLVWRVLDGELEQNSFFGLDRPNEYYYQRSVALAGDEAFSLTMVAAITGSGGYPYNFSFGVASPAGYGYVGLGGTQLAAYTGIPETFNVTYFDFPVGYDAALYNTYRLTGQSGRGTLTVNGVPVFSNLTFGIGPSTFLLFGDGTQLSNGQGYIRSLVFTSGAVPEPASWAMLVAGFGLAGGALRQRRAGMVRLNAG